MSGCTLVCQLLSILVILIYCRDVILKDSESILSVARVLKTIVSRDEIARRTLATGDALAHDLNKEYTGVQ